MKVGRPDRLASSIPADVFLHAAEREELAAAETDLLVLAAEVSYGGSFGAQVYFWLTCDLWAEQERVLALAATDLRQRQVADLRAALRHADAIGPFRLVRRDTAAGKSAWALVPAPATATTAPG